MTPASEMKTVYKPMRSLNKLANLQVNIFFKLLSRLWCHNWGQVLTGVQGNSGWLIFSWLKSHSGTTILELIPADFLRTDKTVVWLLWLCRWSSSWSSQSQHLGFVWANDWHGDVVGDDDTPTSSSSTAVALLLVESSRPNLFYVSDLKDRDGRSPKWSPKGVRRESDFQNHFNKWPQTAFQSVSWVTRKWDVNQNLTCLSVWVFQKVRRSQLCWNTSRRRWVKRFRLEQCEADVMVICSSKFRLPPAL